MISLLISSLGISQNTFEVTTDPVSNGKMLVGVIHKADLTGEPEFNSWYSESQKIYPTMNTDAIEALRANRDKIYILVFGATWCEDSHYVVPKFFKLQEAAGFPEDHIIMYSLNHEKKLNTPIVDAFGVTNTPTIIVMKNGRELGRVVEYGKTGFWDKELADIINGK